MELLDRSSCAASFVAAGHKVDGANIVAGSRTIGHVTFDFVRSAYPYALMLPQSDTERLLDQQLSSLGVTVEREVELTGFTDTGSAVKSTLRHSDGRQEILETDWLIACDGAHSTVRNTLGLQFAGDTLDSDWFLADIHLTGEHLSASTMDVYWHADGLLAIFPISPGRFRVVADAGSLTRRPATGADFGKHPGLGRSTRPRRPDGLGPGLAVRLPDQRTQTEGLPRRSSVPGGRRRPRA